MNDSADRRLVRRVYERHLDLMLAEELECNPAFAQWVIDHAFNDASARSGTVAPRISAEPPTSVTVEVSHDDGLGLAEGVAGEDDVIVEAQWKDRTVRLLIEDKIDAILQPRQIERYLERARLHARLEDVTDAVALVVAPAGYLERHRADLDNVARLSVEDIAEQLGLLAADESELVAQRLRWRAERLIRFEEGRRVPTADHEPTINARDWIMKHLADAESAAQPQASSMRTINTGWLYFTDPNAILYKVIHGYVDIYLRDIWPDDPVHQAVVHEGQDLPIGFQATEDTVGNLILRDVVHEPMPLVSIWAHGRPAQPDDLLTGVEACAVATRWILEQTGRR